MRKFLKCTIVILSLKCGEFNDLIDDQLHGGSGALHIVNINKSGEVHHETIYDRINQAISLFSLKRYKLVDVTP